MGGLGGSVSELAEKAQDEVELGRNGPSSLPASRVSEGNKLTVSGEDLELPCEEQARRRRMLRNRESAARSREKRKQQMELLENSITALRTESETLGNLNSELTALVREMRSRTKRVGCEAYSSEEISCVGMRW